MKYIKFLEKLARKEYTNINPSLEKIKNIMNKLGNPQDKLKIIHIAGTNGKGSTAIITYKLLSEMGYKCGLYTSPHILSFTERIKINESEITHDETENYLKELSKLNPRLFDDLTYFEILTAIGFLHFKERNVDYAVVETGLGGRFDATNVIKRPILSIITNISYDHTEILGNTIKKIASEKAGIIKKDTPTICGNLTDSAFKVIKKIADSNKSKVYKLGRDFFVKQIKIDLEKLTQYISFQGSKEKIDNLEVSCLGEKQPENIAISLLAIELLDKFKNDLIRSALAKIYLPARFEILKLNGRTIIIDGAHNPAAFATLYDSIKKYFNEKFILMMGVLKDKDYRKMCQIISPLVSEALTFTPDSPRGLESRILSRCWEKLKIKTRQFNSLKEAFEYAKGKNQLICIAGSFYTLPEFYESIPALVRH